MIDNLKSIAIVIGATGLVGRALLNALVAAKYYQQVIAVVRTMPDAACVNQAVDYQVLGNFEALGSMVKTLAHDNDWNNINIDAFSALGTTRKAAKSRSNFYQIDFGFNHAFAKAVCDAGARRFFLVSSMGASANSAISFYLRTKGELEEAISALAFDHVCIFRPSLLLGKHDDRLLESLAQHLYLLIRSIAPDFNCRPVEAERVAQSMVKVALQHHQQTLSCLKKTRIIDNASMLKMTNQN